MQSAIRGRRVAWLGRNSHLGIVARKCKLHREFRAHKLNSSMGMVAVLRRNSLVRTRPTILCGGDGEVQFARSLQRKQCRRTLELEQVRVRRGRPSEFSGLAW